MSRQHLDDTHGAPPSPAANQRAGVVSLWTNHAAAAARYFAIAREVGIERPGLPEARIAYLLSEGRIDEVKQALFETQRARSQSTAWIEPTLAAITRTGPTQVALDALTDDYRAGRLGVSMFVDALFVIGDANGFYDAIQAVVASGEPFDVEVLFSETATVLRRDARFIPLMEQLQLVEFWDAAGWPDLCQRAAEQITCT